MLSCDNFFKSCQIETSLFDIEFAKTDPSWNLIKDTFCKNQNNITSKPIPKVIHFIWLGNKLPKIYESNIDEWKQITGFEIELWNDEQAEKFLKDKLSFDIFKRSKNFGIKSDILRYEILNVLGGLYVDIDFLCLSGEFNNLHESTSFYAGICLERPVQINNGIMASIPNHEILKACINNADDTKYINEIRCNETRVLYQTGPWLLTACILQYLQNHNNEDILIFPSKVFHPFPAAYRENQSRDFINRFIEPFSMACHLWHGSWQPNSKVVIDNV
jgi:mannosyltransferase OCH1-like enzyme